MKILITGASGLVGSSLAKALESRGDTVIKLSRQSAPGFVTGDPSQPGEWLNQIDTCDAVVNLAGENLFAKRWTDDFKHRIRMSRVESTRLIAEGMARNPQRADGTPKVFLSASAIGYYGPHGDEELTESSIPGHDFMADVCVAWETAAEPAREAGVRVVHPRFGIVLDATQGALPNLVRPFRLFVGGRVGSGQQWVSWIHRDDLTNVLLRLLDDPTFNGPVNAVAPNPVRNQEMSAAIGTVLGRPNWMPVPTFAIRLALGEVADVAAAGQRVVPDKLVKSGFVFRYPTVQEALADLLMPSKSR